MRINKSLFQKFTSYQPFGISVCFIACLLCCIMSMSSCLASKKNSGLQKVTGSTTSINENNIEQPKQDTLVWFDTLKSGQNEMVVICFTKIGSSIKADTVDYIEIIPTPVYVSNQIDSSFSHKRRYRIAVVLPFMSRGFIASPAKEIPASSMKAVEMYEGILMAIDSLQGKLSIQVDVFDSMRDTSIIRQIIDSDTLKNVDLIIGPVTSQNVKILADYARDNKTYLVSPLNARADLTFDNPYYIQINPSFPSHARNIVQHLTKIQYTDRSKTLENKYIFISGPSDSARLSQLTNAFRLQFSLPDQPLNILRCYSNSIDEKALDRFIDPTKNNILLVPSKSESFVYNVLREAQKFLTTTNDHKKSAITVVGLDQWRYFTRINFDYYEELSLHMSSEYYFDKYAEQTQTIQKNYANRFGINPREFGIIGFDIMKWVGLSLKYFGSHFIHHAWKRHQRGYHTIFNLQPLYEKITNDELNMESNLVRCYENRHLHFLKFDQYELVKVH